MYKYGIVPGKEGKGTKVFLMKGSPKVIEIDKATQKDLKRLYDLGQPFVWREEKKKKVIKQD